MDILNAIQGLLSQGWFWMVVSASAMFAAGNYIDELLLGEYEQPVGTLVIISGLFGLVLTLGFASAAFLFQTTILIGNTLVLQAIGVGVLEALWVIPYLYATKRRGAVVAGPLFQMIPVVSGGLEYLLGSVPTMLHVLGSILIVGGGIILSVEEEEGENGETISRIDWITVGLMSLSVFLVALIYVLFRDAAEEASYTAVGFWSGIGMFLTSLTIWLVCKPYRQDFNEFCRHTNGKALSVQLFNEFLDAGGAYLNHLANLIGPSVMVVSAFNAAQPVFIGLFGLGLGLLGINGFTASRGSLKVWLLIATSITLIAAGTVLVAFGEV